MSTNQLHGKKFEDMIKSLFPGASDHGRSPQQSGFDIEGKYDKILHIPSNIKATKKGSTSYDMADARAMWQLVDRITNGGKIRLIVGMYLQDPTKKIFDTILEYYLSVERLQKLYGNLPFSEVESFHNQLLTFPRGCKEEAKAFAKEHKKKLLCKYSSYIELSQKISDSGAWQRRLQCSIKRLWLDEICPPKEYKDEYRGLVLPVAIKSSAREFNR